MGTDYDFMSHLEKEAQVNDFVNKYLLITLRARTNYDFKVIYEPQSLSFKIIIHLNIDGECCSAGMDCITESCDGLALTKAIEEILRKCREDYTKRTGNYFDRMVYRGR